MSSVISEQVQKHDLHAVVGGHSCFPVLMCGCLASRYLELVADEVVPELKSSNFT